MDENIICEDDEHGDPIISLSVIYITFLFDTIPDSYYDDWEIVDVLVIYLQTSVGPIYCSYILITALCVYAC